MSGSDLILSNAHKAFPSSIYLQLRPLLNSLFLAWTSISSPSYYPPFHKQRLCSVSTQAMASRSTKIKILLVIDLMFFLVELIAGYAVGSLALIADSFHMLNDVVSLVVALYAIKLSAKDSTSDSRYSYGWHRAEILAALVNGVFLLALCFSIAMEALGRFFSNPEISNPKLIVIVGSLGLASNLLGLLLFHEHSHSHSHSHGSDNASAHTSPPSDTATVTDDPSPSRPLQIRRQTEEESALYGHPAATRASFVQTAQELAYAQSPTRERTVQLADPKSPVASSHITSPTMDERSPLLQRVEEASSDAGSPGHKTPDHNHSHSHGKESGGHGHSHGSMNMRALVLHVMGDALGNVGVIATGLVIWLTEWKYKYYFDPIISLVITVIIFSSAMPLVRSTSFILLQAVPANISLDSVRSSILAVDGVESVHELHIWQLSETKIVASVHITADRQQDFMSIAAAIRTELHHHGIHSSTIQPEYVNPRMQRQDTDCLITCPSDQACDPAENACCPPPPVTV
ncbi:cation efflux protein [Pterulicium gracile]|uniref:Cation efflux protein n=1 Tax=Pterulicium gracile TaxID=1884261 RepID=A0A5C3R5X3_9AGAR|nr:cation efflux protein [Pterula gracilis]